MKTSKDIPCVKIILTVPEKYTLDKLIYKLYIKDEKIISDKINDITTAFGINREINVKYARISKSVINDILRIIADEKKREINKIVNGIGNYFD